jgi:hypothetical protein
MEDHQARARSNCAPLYIMDAHLLEGYDESTRNGTATFVQYAGRYYACTCRHMVEIMQKRRDSGQSRFATLALGYKEGFERLSFFTAEGLNDAVRIVPPGVQEDFLDLAIADITNFWPRFSAEWASEAIDMNPDAWHEPRWARAHLLSAAGWPEMGKRNVITPDRGAIVRGTLLYTVANVRAGLSRTDRVVMMESRLDKPHNWFFSGMSGGPMYVIQDEKIVPVGILYDGWPQKPGDVSEEYDEFDIVIRGAVMTPDHFARWLTAAGLIKPLVP